MQIAIVVILLVMAAILEVVLLQRIVFHQAGGWGHPETVYPSVIAWAAVPFIWSAALILLRLARRLVAAPLTTPFVVVAVAGPLLAYVALTQYGHGTPVFMLMGLGIQCIALLIATVCVFMPPNRTPHADARDVPAPAGGSGARAGGRETLEGAA